MSADKLKSVDVMYLSPTENTLYLIEMKRYDPALSVKTADERLKSLQNKVLDSIFILLSITGYLNIDKGFYPFFLNPNQLKVKCILLTDLDDKYLLPLMLANLDKLRINLSRRISDTMIVAMNASMFESKFSRLVAS